MSLYGLQSSQYPNLSFYKLLKTDRNIDVKRMYFVVSNNVTLTAGEARREDPAVAGE